MASAISASLTVAAPTCAPSDVSAPRSFSGLKANTLFATKSSTLPSVSNGSRTSCMLVWEPYNNPRYETLSYLPQLTDEQVLKQVDYFCRQNLIPCLEFDKIGTVYKKHFNGSGYYDGRYWTMWKLPMFGCKDPVLVLNEINECKKAYPKCFIRVIGFDQKRQVQISGFVVYKPKLA